MKLLIGLLAVLLYAQAPIPGALNGTGGGGSGTTLPITSEPIANPGTAEPYSYIQGATGSVGITQTAKNQDVVSVNDFGADATGVADSSAAFNSAAHALYLKGGGTVLVPKGTYKLSTANYQVVLPGDNGDYGNSAGGIGGAVTATISGGVVNSLNVTPGSGYPHSTTMLLTFSNATPNTGTGATGTITTNSSGQLGTATIVNGGVGYTVIPMVSISVQGGDGAAGTVVLSGGAVTTPVLTTGGNGYAVSGTTPAGVTGLTCTVYPTLTATTTSSGAVASFVVSVAGSGCTGTPVVVFGASCGGAQCALLVPEAPQVMGCAVRTYNNVTFAGEGPSASIVTTGWDNVTANNSQLIAFCDPDGQGKVQIGFKNLFVSGAFIGYYGINNTNQSSWTNLRYLNVGIPAFSVEFDTGTSFEHIWNESHAGLTCGGSYISRINAVQEGGGFCDKTILNDVTFQPAPSSTYSTVEQNLDKWFETNIWKTQNGPFTGTSLPNGQCYITNSTSSPRLTDFNYGNSPNQISNAPQTSCYQGVVGWAFEAYSRYSRYSHELKLSSISNACGLRGIVVGDFAGSITNANTETTGGIGGGCSNSPWTADPYLPPSSLQPAAIYGNMSNGAPSSVLVQNLEVTGQYQQAIKFFSGASDVSNQYARWTGLINISNLTLLQPNSNSWIDTNTNTSDHRYNSKALAANGQIHSSQSLWTSSCWTGSAVDCSWSVQVNPQQNTTTPDVTLQWSVTGVPGVPHFALPSNSDLGFSIGSKISSPADSKLLLTNQAGTDFSTLQFGGTGVTFPALRRTTTTLDVIRADASQFADLRANRMIPQSGISFTGITASFPALFDTGTTIRARLADNSADAAMGAKAWFGGGTATFSPQTGAGTGATAVCATSHVCDSFSGEVTLTTGSVGTPATGSQLIVTLGGVTRTNQPNCTVTVEGGTTFLGVTHSASTTALTVSAGVALVFATPYEVTYVCGGQ